MSEGSFWVNTVSRGERRLSTVSLGGSEPVLRLSGPEVALSKSGDVLHNQRDPIVPILGWYYRTTFILVLCRNS